MTLRKTRLELFEAFQVWKAGGDPEVEGEFVVEVWQKQPWTGARVVVDGQVGFGFSKVMHPDKWDAAFGEELAVHKAIADAVGEDVRVE